jgi:putative transposase
MQMISVIDVFSRRKVSHLAPAESSQAVADLLIKAFIILGIPDEIVSDRGAAFLSERTQRAMARLGIKWTAVRAYSGEKKPFVERGAMGSVLHMFFENLPGYSGHSPAEASAIRKRKSFAQRRGQNMAKLYRVELTAAELQTLLDQYLEHIDGNRKQAGRKPNEVLADAERRGQVQRIADDRLLDLILGEDGVSVIGKKGLRVSNAFYWDDALVEHIGHTVQYVRTRDAGKLIVYTADAKPHFVCVAIDPEALGLDREVMAIAGKQRQAAVMREGMDELRALKRKHRPDKMFREIIDHAVARAAVAIPAESNIEPLPYRSSAIEAAADALKALDAPAESTPHDEEILREGARAIEAIEQRRAAREADLSDDEVWSLWVAIRRAGRRLSEREQAFLSRYGNTAESWAASYEGTPEFQAGLVIERWSADEGEAHDEGKNSCERKSA